MRSYEVDYRMPIEAVHADGRVAEVQPTTMPSQARMAYAGSVEHSRYAFDENGWPLSSTCPWRIRNVATAAKYPDALAELCREMLRYQNSGDTWHLPYSLHNRLQNAVAELPAEVDGDEKLATRIAMTNAPETFPTDTAGLATWVLMGIKAARANKNERQDDPSPVSEIAGQPQLEREQAGEGRGA